MLHQSSSDKIGPKLLAMFGIAVGRVASTVIEAKAGRSVVITVECFPEMDVAADSGPLEKEIRTFRLVEDV